MLLSIENGVVVAGGGGCPWQSNWLKHFIFHLAVFDEVCYPANTWTGGGFKDIAIHDGFPTFHPQHTMLEVITFSKYGIRKRQYNLWNLTRQILKFHIVRTSFETLSL